MNNNCNLYLFNKEILSEELYNLIKELHGYRHIADYDKIWSLELVPGSSHFVSVNSGTVWSYREKVIVTKEQIDKFIQINNVVPMDFIEFIESYKD